MRYRRGISDVTIEGLLRYRRGISKLIVEGLLRYRRGISDDIVKRRDSKGVSNITVER